MTLIRLLSLILVLATSASAWSFVPEDWPEALDWAQQPVTKNYIFTDEHNAIIASLPNIDPTPNVPRTPCLKEANAATYGRNGSCWWSCQTEKTKCLRETDISACKKDHFGLIFADGVTKHTGKTLDLLQERGLKVTFCLIGARLVQDQFLARRIVDEGHDLCMLTWSHWPMTSTSSRTIISDIMWSAKAFLDVLGVLPELILPPHGSLDDRVRDIVHGLGFKVLMWNLSVKNTRPATRSATGDDALDRKYTDMKSVKAEFNSLYQKEYPEGILSLHHESFQASLRYATFVLNTVQPKYKIVPISECLQRSVWRIAPGELPVPDVKPVQVLKDPPISVSAGLLVVFGSALIVSMVL